MTGKQSYSQKYAALLQCFLPPAHTWPHPGYLYKTLNNDLSPKKLTCFLLHIHSTSLPYPHMSKTSHTVAYHHTVCVCVCLYYVNNPPQAPFFTYNMSACHSRKSTSVNNKMAEFHLAASVSGSCYCACWFTVVTLLGHLNRAEPSLMLLVTPSVLFLWKRAYTRSQLISYLHVYIHGSLAKGHYK